MKPSPERPDGRRGERRAGRRKATIQGLPRHRNSRAAHRSPPHRAAGQMKTIEVPLDPFLSRRFPGSHTSDDSIPRLAHPTPWGAGAADLDPPHHDPEKREVYFRATSKGLTRSPDFHFAGNRITC